MGTSFFRYVTMHAFDRQTDKKYRALHYKQSHGKTYTRKTTNLKKQLGSCETFSGTVRLVDISSIQQSVNTRGD